VAAWIVVGVRTAAGTCRGTLLRAAPGSVSRGRAVSPADEPVFPADEPVFPADQPVFPADEVAGLTPTGEGITGRPA
jgi:hypothetical protein